MVDFGRRNSYGDFGRGKSFGDFSRGSRSIADPAESQGIHKVKQVPVESLLDLQGLFNGHVHDLALLHADYLVADAVAQQLDGQVAGFESEGAVAGRRSVVLQLPDSILTSKP